MTLFHNVFFSGDDGEANKQKNGASYHNSNRTLLFSGDLFFTFFFLMECAGCKSTFPEGQCGQGTRQ